MSDLIKYPPTEFEDYELLVTTLGTFWSRECEDRRVLLGMAAAAATAHRQTQADITRAELMLDRHTIPVLRERTWTPLLLRRSAMNMSDVSVARFGDDHVFGGDLQFGVPAVAESRYVFALPDPAIRGIRLLYNRITAPSAVLIAGTDFEVDPVNGSIAFLRNVFESPHIQGRSVLVDGEPDVEIVLWAYLAEHDARDIFNHLGYVVKYEAPSSRGYRDVCNALLDAHVAGPTEATFTQLLCGAAGIQAARGDETVEVILSGDLLQIVTDKHVYEFPGTCTPAVAVGSKVGEGDILINELRVLDTQAGVPPEADLSPILGLTLGPEFFGGRFYSPLTFLNREVEVRVVTLPGGQTDIEFEVGGFPTDVDLFWEQVHAAGVASGSTLAHRLDTRDSGNGEPLSIHLPETINPLRLLLDVVGPNLKLVWMSSAVFSSMGAGPGALRLLSDGLNPRMVSRIIVDVDLGVATQDDAAMDSVDEIGYGVVLDEETNFGPEETYWWFAAVEGIVL